MTLNRKSMDGTVLSDIVWYPNEGFTHQFNLWNWEAYVHKWFKCNRDMIAVSFRTLDSALKLAMH